MSLETPIKIRMLQRKLYQKAKEEPSYRFYLLYDKMYREDVLAHAYALVRSNQGAPGVDGQNFRGIESQGLEEWLSGIREDLRAKTYQPQAVRRVMIPKPGGGERPLGIAVAEHDGNLVRFNPRFLAFAREYNFIPRACHVAAAWEKGKV